MGNTVKNQVNQFGLDEICPPKRAVTFWSPEHSSSTLGANCDTYQALRHAERAAGSACSTTLHVDDDGIKGVVKVFENESFSTLKYHDAVPVVLRLVAYRGADHVAFKDAQQDGAIYDTGIVLTMGDQAGNALRYQTAFAAMQTTSKMINDDQSLPALALVDDQDNETPKNWCEIALNDPSLTHFFTVAFIEKVLIGYDEDIPR